jgi:hypothetical protein
MLFDVIGMLGVAMILVTYAMIQLDRVDVKSIIYSSLNALGAGLILVSLVIDFNLSAFMIEGCWMLISLVGIFSAFKRRREA